MGPLPGALRPTEPVEFPFVAWHRCFSLRRLACTSAAAGVSLFQRDRGAGLPTTCRLSSGCICFAAPESFRSEEHTSELQSLMRISYAVFCLKQKSILSLTHFPYFFSSF